MKKKKKKSKSKEESEEESSQSRSAPRTGIAPTQSKKKWLHERVLSYSDKSYDENTVRLLQKRARLFLFRNELKKAKQRLKSVNLVIDSELNYINQLLVIIEVFLNPLRNKLKKGETVLSENDISLIFQNIEQIYQAHKIVLEELQERIKKFNIETIFGDIFMKLAKKLQESQHYIKNIDLAIETYNMNWNRNKEFIEFCRAASTNSRTKMQLLSDLLAIPMERIPRYRVLLGGVLRNTPMTHPDYERLWSAQNSLETASRQIQDTHTASLIRKESLRVQTMLKTSSKRRKSIQFAGSNELIMEGDFVWKGKKRHLFLFNNQLVCTSVKKGNHKIKWACTLLNATLEFKKEMCTIKLTEKVILHRYPFFGMVEYELIEIVKGEGEIWASKMNLLLGKMTSMLGTNLSNSEQENWELSIMSERDWNILLSGAEEVVYIDKELLIKQGEPFKYFFKLKSGKVKVQKQLSKEKIVTVAEITNGGFFGEMSLLERKTMANVVADKKVHVYRIGATALQTLLQLNSDLSERFFKMISVTLANRLHRASVQGALNKLNQQQRPDLRLVSLMKEQDCQVTKSSDNKLFAERDEKVAKELFKMAKSDILLKESKCKYGSRWGTLFIFGKNITFYAKLLGSTTKFVIPLSSISEIAIEKNKLFVGSSIERAKFEFKFKENELNVLKEIFDLLNTIWKPNTLLKQMDSVLSLKKENAEEAGYLFSMNVTEWDEIISLATVASFEKDKIIMKEGQTNQSLYQIINGICAVERLREDGTGRVELGRMRKGEIFGELTFLLGGTASVSVVAQSSHVDILIINKLDLQPFFQKRMDLCPKFYKYLATQISNRIRSKEAQDEELELLETNANTSLTRTRTGTFQLTSDVTSNSEDLFNILPSKGRDRSSTISEMPDQRRKPPSIPELKSTLPSSSDFTLLDTSLGIIHPSSPSNSKSKLEQRRTVSYRTMKAPPKLEVPPFPTATNNNSSNNNKNSSNNNNSNKTSSNNNNSNKNSSNNNNFSNSTK